MVLSVALKVKYFIDSNQIQGASMKDINYALMLIKANKLDSAKDKRSNNIWNKKI